MAMETAFRQKEDRIFDLSNELLYYKNICGHNTNMTLTSFDDINNTSNSVLKKKKIDDYVKKKKNNEFLLKKKKILEFCPKKSTMLTW